MIKVNFWISLYVYYAKHRYGCIQSNYGQNLCQNLCILSRVHNISIERECLTASNALCKVQNQHLLVSTR